MTRVLEEVYTAALVFLLSLPLVGPLVAEASCRHLCRRLTRLATESGLTVTACGCEDGAVVITADPPPAREVI
jgi:hypothetical protein